MKHTSTILRLSAGLLLFATTAGITGYFVYRELNTRTDDSGTHTVTLDDLSTFATASEFTAYLAEAEQVSSSDSWMAADFETNDARSDTAEIAAPTDGSAGDEASRYSETNVQVLGIDEPDIVKTDGSSIYYSHMQDWVYYDFPTPMDDIVIEEQSDEGIYDQPQSATSIIGALPPETMSELSSLDATGDLLLSDNTLIILGSDSITGYDVTNPSTPSKRWTITLEDSSGITASRLSKGNLYVISQTYIDYSTPCPFQPMTDSSGELMTVACPDIYHPDTIVPIDTTYTIAKINPSTGKILDHTSFVGAEGISVVYMSEQAVYLSYSYSGNTGDIYLSFLLGTKDILSDTVLEHLRDVQSYTLSQSAKSAEVDAVISRYLSTLTADESSRVQTELADQWNTFAQKHIRDFHRTGIVCVNTDSLDVSAHGEVPGTPLNQFSFDEYDGYLRVATTSDQVWWSFGGSTKSVNDMCVLNDKLSIAGSVRDLGLDESIYAVRFLRDMGYVVTFKQTDPLYVLDLSDPQNPELKGELEIPGYSSYLHPLTSNLMLGVGQDDWRVKLSLFDISNPSNPRELDTYILDEYWTEISSTHHAFLQDADKSLFFIPGNTDEYAFSYADNSLSLEKAIANVSPVRAIYIDDYLYVIGAEDIVAVDENKWERVGEVGL